jgi:hypothetical protein
VGCGAQLKEVYECADLFVASPYNEYPVVVQTIMDLKLKDKVAQVEALNLRVDGRRARYV